MTQLDLDLPMPSSLPERTARLETKVDNLGDTIERNRLEAKHDRDNLRQQVQASQLLMNKKLDSMNTSVDQLLELFQQAKGAKKVLTVFASIAGLVGMAGLSKLVEWASSVLTWYQTAR